MPLYVNFDQNEDVIVNDANKVTEGYFTNGVGTVVGSTLTTSSLSATQKNYYYNVQHSSADHFSVAYGHIGGSGSSNVTNVKGETEVIYKQFANLLLDPTKNETGDSIEDGFQFVSGTLANDIYVIVAERARMKDRLNKKNWTLQLSGSTTIKDGITRHFTDDSATVAASASPVGPRYNIVSGSDGTKVGTDIFGWYYPNMGIMVFNATSEVSGLSSLSSSLPGSPAYVNSASDATVVHNGFAPELNNDATADNAFRMFIAMNRAAEQKFRNEEDQKTVSYFCRAKANHFNFSNNPTFTSGSANEYRQPTMEGNPSTFITTVGLYDNTETLVAVGRLSKPIHKNFDKEAIMKVNITY
tara:strand:- start:33 stop:1103 length:1071 start_codon:yes stop_codon:yes gene_type:complete